MTLGKERGNPEHIGSILIRVFEALIKNYEAESGAPSLDPCGGDAPSLQGGSRPGSQESNRMDGM